MVQHLLDSVPEFRSRSQEWDEDLPNEVFGSFALYLCEIIRSGADAGVASAGFRLLDEMADCGDEDVVNLLVVSVLEILEDDETCANRCKSECGAKVRALMERVEQGWPQAH